MGALVDKGLSYNLYQLRNSPNFIELLKIYLEVFEEIGDILVQIQFQQNVDDAEGFQLDIIGEDVGIRREGRTDEEYRRVIKIQIILNAGEGTHNTVLELWQLLLETNNASLTPEYPAGVALYSGVGISDFSILNILEQALPLTVTASITASFSDEPAFCFEGGDGEGWGTTEDDTIGGELISRYIDV